MTNSFLPPPQAGPCFQTWAAAPSYLHLVCTPVLEAILVTRDNLGMVWQCSVSILGIIHQTFLDVDPMRCNAEGDHLLSP